MLITQTPEIHRYQFAYTGFLHGYAIDHIHGAHGLFVVRYNDELAVLTKLFDHLGELTHVGIIQWCIHLIQNTEWRRLDEIDGKQQGRCR